MNETQLLEKDQECKKLSDELDQTQHALEQLKVDLNSKNQKLAALAAQAENTTEIDSLRADVEEYEKKVAERDAQLTELQEKHDSVVKSVNDQTIHIEKLEKAGSLKQTELEKLTEELSRKSKDLIEIQGQIKSFRE